MDRVYVLGMTYFREGMSRKDAQDVLEGTGLDVEAGLQGYDAAGRMDHEERRKVA